MDQPDQVLPDQVAPQAHRAQQALRALAERKELPDLLVRQEHPGLLDRAAPQEVERQVQVDLPGRVERKA